MYGLVPTTLALTVGLTAAAFMVSVFNLGAGFLLYIAALGEAAVWLLPVHLAIALPAAVFGGALLSAAGPRNSDERPEPIQVLVLALIGTLTSVALVGWVMPAGYRASSASMARFQDRPAQAPTESPASFDLERLLTDQSPAAREDLRERMRVVVPCLALGVIATILIASPLPWPRAVALGLTLIVFVWQVQHLIERFEQ